MQGEKVQILKRAIRRNYGRTAVDQTRACCAPGCCSSASPTSAAEHAGYEKGDLGSIPDASILGMGCGTPVKFAALKEGEIVVDLGSGAGIDVFLSANKVGPSGRVVGIDLTDEMLERARRNAHSHGYSNVEFKMADIEEHIPVEDGSVDVVISNCVINLTVDKQSAFEEARRILRRGGRMVVSDLVADRAAGTIDSEKWSVCIDGALTRPEYLGLIAKAGLTDITVIEERDYLQESPGGRTISSIVVRAVKP